MTNAQTTAPIGQPGTMRRSWRAPRSFGGTLALFVIGYLVWQPFAAAVLPRLVGTPRLEGRAAWEAFLLIVPVLGMIAGSLYWLGAKRPRGAFRYWLRSTARMLAMSTMLLAPRVGAIPLPVWCGVVLVMAAFLGVLFGWMERWETVPAPPSAAGHQGTAPEL